MNNMLFLLCRFGINFSTLPIKNLSGAGVGSFEWMRDAELRNGKNHLCILEVDLQYPKELHDFHNDYPLAPERFLMGKVEKLIPNLQNKKSMLFHYENLKLY